MDSYDMYSDEDATDMRDMFKTDIGGWSGGWIGPRDYRCEVCHCGFMADELVYLLNDGLPFHKYCLSKREFRNRIKRGVTVIWPHERNLDDAK